MSFSPEVLLVDDNIGGIMWLFDFLNWRGYSVDHVSNERSAEKKLEAVRRGEKAYALVILDVMIAIDDVANIEELNDTFYEKSVDSGIRLCRYAREKLNLPKEHLPIICFSARDDENLKRQLLQLEVPLFGRSDEVIRDYLIAELPPLS